ncbi:MAG: polyphosphate polymerase domain-containing protein [Ruminococcaceae bacterium]|nr:polyphosphate polymerase domain-containing protein [Oscillospiraceae bacterium]
MGYQSNFKRYEIKYLLTPEQKALILSAMADNMLPDKFFRSTIRNLYFDTGNYQLIRHSIERPAYKEKLRVRSYREAAEDTEVFVELKKKYDHVVYKRRVALREWESLLWLRGGGYPRPPCQISREIDYFLSHYPSLHPTVFLSYDREAYRSKDGSDFRMTFDSNILCRQEDLSLACPVWGTALLPENRILMELKTSGGIPLWLTHILSEQHIYKTSFSKYGTAYQTMIFPTQTGGNLIHA